MRNSGAKLAVGFATVACIVVGFSGFLGKMSEPIDAELHSRATSQIDSVHQADQSLQRHVLLARGGFLENYDALVSDSTRLQAAVNGLAPNIQGVIDAARLQEPNLALRKAVSNRVALLERFKPLNAISRNSLRYLPTAWSDFNAHRSSTDDATRARWQQADDMVRRAMDAYVSPTQKNQEVAQASFTSFVPQTPSGTMLKRHTERVLQANQELATFVDDLTDPTVSRTVTVFRQQFDRVVARKNRNIRRWQNGFVVWAAFVLALLFVAAIKLIVVYRNLDRMVRSRTKSLHKRTQELSLIFQTLDQGFVLVDRDGRVRPERSKILERWFGATQEDGTIGEVFAAADRNLAAWLDLAWEDIFDGLLPPHLALQQLPRHVANRAGMTFSIDYRVTESDEGEEQVLVVVSDTTAAKLLAKAERAQRQTAAVIEAMKSDKIGFTAFITETSDSIGVLESSVDVTEIKRVVHTLKGNAASLGLDGLRRWAEDAEDRMETSGEQVTEDALRDLSAQWQHLLDDASLLVQDIDASTISVPKKDIRSLAKEVAEIPGGEAIATSLHAFSLQPVRECFERAARQAQRVNALLDKTPAHVQLADGGVRLDAESFRPFWSVFIHAVRNSVDHGLEHGRERKIRGKPEAGRLRLTATRTATHVRISIEDDGAGIDWDQVAAKAAERGLPSATRQDKIAALLSAGVSTAKSVTEISGRGVGLSAVADVVASLGGDIEVESEPGVGTTFHFDLPCHVDGTAVSHRTTSDRATAQFPSLATPLAG